MAEAEEKLAGIDPQTEYPNLKSLVVDANGDTNAWLSSQGVDLSVLQQEQPAASDSTDATHA